MSVGSEGPYMEMDGPGVWVPRTVPYLRARLIAKEALWNSDYGDRLAYRGKTDAELLGFTRDCFCEEVCEDRTRDEYGDLVPDGAKPCSVPAWAFEIVEP